MKKKLDGWKKRNLTLMGKSYLIKSVGISALLYALEIQCAPENVIKEVNDIMWYFIWDGKPERVKRTVCMRNVTDGGLGVPNIRALLDACRIKILANIVSDGLETWKLLPKSFLGILNEPDPMKTIAATIQNREGRVMPPFYVECLEAWCSLNCNKHPKERNIRDYFVRDNIDLNIDHNKMSVQLKNDIWKPVEKCPRKELYVLRCGTVNISRKETEWSNKYVNIEWNKVYNPDEKKMCSRKVSEFQWKCINGAVTTGEKLKKMNLTDGVCKMCGCEQETLEHMLVDCDTLNNFWTIVIQMIKKNVPDFCYKEKHVFVGYTDGDYQTNNIVNFLQMNAIWQIWKRRCVIMYDERWITEEELWEFFLCNIRSAEDIAKHFESNKVKELFNKLKC